MSKSAYDRSAAAEKRLGSVSASGKPSKVGTSVVGKKHPDVLETPKVVYDDSLRHPVRMIAVKAEPLSGRDTGFAAAQALPQNGETGLSINCEPRSLVLDISRQIEAVVPSKEDIKTIRDRLQELKAEATPELVVECFYRCLLTDWLQDTFALALDTVPRVVNSSHWAARFVCRAPEEHGHATILDAAWEAAWRRLRPAVDIYVDNVRGGRSLKRADLYIVAQGKVVFVEFKYVERHGLRNPKAVARQVQRFVDYHAETVLVIYSGSKVRGEIPGVAQVREILPKTVPIVELRGLAIPSQ